MHPCESTNVFVLCVCVCTCLCECVCLSLCVCLDVRGLVFVRSFVRGRVIVSVFSACL